MPATSPQDIESKIHWEHTRYLVAELDVKVGVYKSAASRESLFLGFPARSKLNQAEQPLEA